MIRYITDLLESKFYPTRKLETYHLTEDDLVLRWSFSFFVVI